MSTDNDAPPLQKPAAAARLRPEDTDALWWLARWIGIPFLIVVAAFYSEYLFPRRAVVDIVPTITRQEVHAYPFPPGATGPSFAPPEVPRVMPIPPPATVEMPRPPTSADIVARPIAQPQPDYPRRALDAEREGAVRLRITIATDGSVSDAVVLYARPEGWFEAAAIAGVKRWRYQPTPRPIATEVEIEFKLN